MSFTLGIGNTNGRSLLDDDGAIVIDKCLFGFACKSVQEANYLLAIINSHASV